MKCKDFDIESCYYCKYENGECLIVTFKKDYDNQSSIKAVKKSIIASLNSSSTIRKSIIKYQIIGARLSKNPHYADMIEKIMLLK